MITFKKIQGLEQFSGEIEWQEIQSLDKKHFPFPWSPTGWEDLKKQKFNLFLACFESRTIGFALFILDDFEKKGHLVKIIISPLWQQQGQGIKLWNFSISTLAAEGYKTIFLEVSVKNNIAFEFYQKVGFKVLVKKQ